MAAVTLCENQELRQNKQTDNTNFKRKFKINGKHLVFYVINKDISSILTMPSLK